MTESLIVDSKIIFALFYYIGSACFSMGILSGTAVSLLIFNGIASFFDISKLTISKIREKIKERKLEVE